LSKRLEITKDELGMDNHDEDEILETDVEKELV
jgi:hypothetical protein